MSATDAGELLRDVLSSHRAETRFLLVSLVAVWAIYGFHGVTPQTLVNPFTDFINIWVPSGVNAT